MNQLGPRLASTVAVPVLALLLGCAGEDTVTFDTLGRAEARASADYGICHCPDGTICLVCSGPSFDAYRVTLEDPEASGDCARGEEDFSVSFSSETGEDMEASAQFSCPRLEATVEVSEGEDAPDGTLTLSDGLRSFRIEQPFRQAGLQLLTDVPSLPDRLEVSVGQELELEFSGDDLERTKAVFQREVSGTQPSDTIDADVVVSGASLVVTVPELETGAYTLFVSATPLLPEDACYGPIRCIGLSQTLEVEAYVP
jgi:hypothetical protein